MSFLSLPVPRKPRNSGRRLLGWLAARPFHLATQSTPPRPSGRWAGGARDGEGARRLSRRGGRLPRASAGCAFRAVCARRAPPASARSRPFSRSRRLGQRAPPHGSPQAPVGLRGARTGPAQAPHSGRPAREFARPALHPLAPQLGACAGRVAVAGVPAAASAAAAAAASVSASVSQSVPSNGGRR